MPLHLQLRGRFRIQRPKSTKMEKGEISASNSSTDDVWAKLVPLNSSCPDIELRLNEETICSNIKTSSFETQVWCQITRETDHNSALMKNKCCSSILVDGAVVREDDTATIRCGSEMILGPVADGFLRYVFIVIPTKEMCKKQLKVTLDPEHAKCPICLNVWHDVVTVAPCLHNFCNGCFSGWLKRCQQRRSSVRCPQCRAEVQFVARNHFLHKMEEDILKYDSSLRHSDAELVLLESCSSIKSPLCLVGANSSSEEESEYDEEGVDSLSDEETDYEEEGVEPDHAAPDPVPAFDHAAFEQRWNQSMDDLRSEQMQLRREFEERMQLCEARHLRIEEEQRRIEEDQMRWWEEQWRKWKERSCRNEDCMKMMQDLQARCVGPPRPHPHPHPHPPPS